MLLLNNDAVADPGLPAALAAAAAERPDAGVLACKVFFADPPDVLMYAGGRVNLRLGYWGRQDGFGQRDDGRFDTLRDVDRATGAAMAVSRAAIERAGLLDESLFAYAEDTEWCLRIREAGFGVVFVPDAKVWHVGSASTGGMRSPTSIYYDTRNMIAVAERHDPRGGAAAAIRRGVVLGCAPRERARCRRSARGGEGLARRAAREARPAMTERIGFYERVLRELVDAGARSARLARARGRGRAGRSRGVRGVRVHGRHVHEPVRRRRRAAGRRGAHATTTTRSTSPSSRRGCTTVRRRIARCSSCTASRVAVCSRSRRATRR